jgi:glycerol-3-phosphate acyltransferase PlsX
MVMKTAEGVAIAVGKLLKQGIMASSKAKFGYLFMKGVFKELKNKTTADSIGGAILIGADGIVIKAHGSSNGPSFQAAISLARRAVLGNVNEKMKAIIGDKDE